MTPREFLSKDWKNESMAEGGIYYRAFDLIEFMEKVEETTGKIVSIKFDGSKNIEFLFQRKEWQP